MARTRAERRHNTHVKTSARKAIKSEGRLYCGQKIAPNGEVKSCSFCVTCLATDRHYNEMWMKAQLASFMKSFE